MHQDFACTTTDDLSNKPLFILHLFGQIIATSAKVTLNLKWWCPQKLGTIGIWPDLSYFMVFLFQLFCAGNFRQKNMKQMATSLLWPEIDSHTSRYSMIRKYLECILISYNWNSCLRNQPTFPDLYCKSFGI